MHCKDHIRMWEEEEEERFPFKVYGPKTSYEGQFSAPEVLQEDG